MMKTIALKVKTNPIKFERFDTCSAYSSMCFCYNKQEAIECSLGLKLPIEFDEYRAKPCGFCPVVQGLN